MERFSNCRNPFVVFPETAIACNFDMVYNTIYIGLNEPRSNAV